MRLAIRQLIVNANIALTSCLFGTAPVPYWYWIILRKLVFFISQDADPLRVEITSTRGDVSFVPPLEGLLNASDTLGLWTLGQKSLNFFWRQLEQHKPRVIVEFGAGLSTLLLTTYANRESEYGRQVTIISIEQSVEVKSEVESRLSRHGLRSEILYFPAEPTGYAISLDALKRVLDGKLVDFVIVDGPAGPNGCRTGTLQKILSFCRNGAQWYLDDSYRDSELSTLAQWSEAEEILIRGIIPLEHGIATGIVKTHSCRNGGTIDP